MGNKRRKSGSRWKVGAVAVLAVATLTVGGVALTQDRSAKSEAATFTPAPLPTRVEARNADTVLKGIRAQIAGTEPLTISVLGDSTGNASGEWVDLWAEHLSSVATVTVHWWDEGAGNWKAEPTVYEGPGRSITIWNGSHPGATYVYALERLDVIQPEKPSFTVLNYGHNIAKKSAGMGADELVLALNEKWKAELPVSVVLQNPAQGSRADPTAASVAALISWSSQAGYPVINVNDAFRKAAELPALLQDQLHPNPRGSRVWADAVIATLG